LALFHPPAPRKQLITLKFPLDFAGFFERQPLVGPRITGEDRQPDTPNRPAAAPPGDLLLLSRAPEIRGRRESRMPAGTRQPGTQKTGRRRTSFHSPQGSTDIRFSLHDGL
jgi:hypothetical protein